MSSYAQKMRRQFVIHLRQNLPMRSPVHNNIANIRKSKGITRSKVAYVLGIDESAYGKIERGETKIDVDRLYALSDLFKVPISLFFGSNAFYELKTDYSSSLALQHRSVERANLEILTLILNVLTKLSQQLEKIA
jgi:transcriptional regulator with XRE-family HTH domain